jgi:hypothetical protein
MAKISGNMVLFRLIDAICQKVGRILIVLESAVVPLQFRAQQLQQFIVLRLRLRKNRHAARQKQRAA